MSYQQVKTGHRFAGMFIDYLIIFFGLGIVALLTLLLIDMNVLVVDPDISAAETVVKWAMIILLALWMAKDVFGGQSLAKRVLKQQLVSNKTEEVADPFLTLLRNLFSFAWPVEFVWAMVNPERRLGDFVAGTKLISYKESTPAPSAPIWRSFLALGLSFVFMYLLINPLFPSYEDGRGSDIEPQIESVNEAKSKVLEEALLFKMAEAFPEISVTVYENSDIEGEGFIQVELFREAEKSIGLSRLYNFREMIIEISDHTLPET
ncbi:MAG: RDD family protein, partial [Bacteroidia bacterium]